ncbi:MAG: RsmD family RNA methyltransferase [Akkermansia sp.]
MFPSPASRVTLCWKRPRPRRASRDNKTFLSFRKNIRIISGKAGGMACLFPKGSAAHDRPGQGGPFSILNPLIGHADVLDLFTGSGAFGLKPSAAGQGSRMVDFPAFLRDSQGQSCQTGLEGGAVIRRRRSL